MGWFVKSASELRHWHSSRRMSLCVSVRLDRENSMYLSLTDIRSSPPLVRVSLRKEDDEDLHSFIITNRL